MTWTVKTHLPVEFEIRKTENVLSFKEISADRKVIVIDQTVYDLYKDALPLDAHTVILPIESSESTKDWKSAHRILTFLEENGVLRRSEPVIAIGGGVLLDMVGFACSVYRRGVPYIRIPTTLLGIVDASVGAKTSINHFGRRNRIGSFFTPTLTLIDKSFIKTQDSREIANGIAEILKLAIVLDKTLFELIEVNPELLIKQKFQNNLLADQIIDRAITGMTKELNNNLWETELQRAVDYGHTFSPIVEMKNVPELLHGEAVIIDCLLSACISVNRGILPNSELIRIFNLLTQVGLPTQHIDFYDVDILHSGLKDVMIHRNNNQYLPIPTAIGKCIIINDLDFREIELAVNKLKAING
jgi:3-dehydroquinate synthetase